MAVQPIQLQIVTGSSRPIGKQIADAVRMKITTGELRPGAQLPSVRGLAQQLTINHNTVSKVYSELVQEGWLESRQGLGFFVVVPRQRLNEIECERRLDEIICQFINEVIALGYPLDEAQVRLAAEAEQLVQRKRA